MAEMETCAAAVTKFRVVHRSFGAVGKQGEFLAFRGVCNFSLEVIQGMGKELFQGHKLMRNKPKN